MRYTGPMLILDDPEIERMAHELAARTGATPAEAVKALLTGTLAQTPPAPRVKDRAMIEAIIQRVASKNDIGLTSDHSDLYDEDGLPA